MISDAKGVVQLAVVGGMLSSSLGGMAVANVLRRLDNVVKEYSASVANIATAILCSFLFPEAFQVTLRFLNLSKKMGIGELNYQGIRLSIFWSTICTSLLAFQSDEGVMLSLQSQRYKCGLTFLFFTHCHIYTSVDRPFCLSLLLLFRHVTENEM